LFCDYEGAQEGAIIVNHLGREWERRRRERRGTKCKFFKEKLICKLVLLFF